MSTTRALPEGVEVLLAFCPTGPGGGVDNSCGGGGGGATSAHDAKLSVLTAKQLDVKSEKQKVFAQIKEAKAAGDQTKVNSLYQKSSKLNKQMAALEKEKASLMAEKVAAQTESQAVDSHAEMSAVALPSAVATAVATPSATPSATATKLTPELEAALASSDPAIASAAKEFHVLMVAADQAAADGETEANALLKQAMTPALTKLINAETTLKNKQALETQALQEKAVSAKAAALAEATAHLSAPDKIAALDAELTSLYAEQSVALKSGDNAKLKTLAASVAYVKTQVEAVKWQQKSAQESLAKAESHIAAMIAKKQDVMKQIQQAKAEGNQTKVNSLYQQSSKLNKLIKAAQAGEGAAAGAGYKISALNAPSSIAKTLLNGPIIQESCCVDPSVKTGTAHKEVLAAAYADLPVKLGGSTFVGTTYTPSDEWRAMKYYTSSGYDTLNPVLRQNKGDLTTIHDEKALKHIKSLDSAIEKAGRTTADVIVARGVKNGARWQHLKTGDVFVDHGFGSTSVSNSTASSFAGEGKERTLLNIRVPKGSRGMFVGHHSSVGHENEFILPRGTHFKIEGVTAGTRSNGMKFRVMQVVVVDTATGQQL